MEARRKITRRHNEYCNTSFQMDDFMIGPKLVELLSAPAFEPLKGLQVICSSSTKPRGSGPEDFSHLPPEQRRKKLQGKIDDLNKDIQKEMDQRDALTKMRDVYVKNPQMGDPASVDPRLSEIGQNIEKLQFEVQKFEGWLAEVEERMPSKSDTHRRSGLYETQNNTTVSNNCAQDRESPDGSYTEEQNSETQVKANINPILPTSSTPEFDDEFDDEETLPTIGTCKALYPFEGHNEGTIAVAEGELLYVIEEDKGDGWTRVRRNEDEEGYVPSSYVEIPKSVRLAEEWQGKQPWRNHHVPHTLTESERETKLRCLILRQGASQQCGVLHACPVFLLAPLLATWSSDKSDETQFTTLRAASVPLLVRFCLAWCESRPPDGESTPLEISPVCPVIKGQWGGWGLSAKRIKAVTSRPICCQQVPSQAELR
ncbi:hypothetical protein FQN60_008163 [Etheostoma spectabile]|uniref:SH3 domain-containing protein n=1 Tax=Etheostoma spectabile TaxID=54343 RepID=A0A5J5CQB0_9PERO|nr:hypothetical protein FQN60_008163 [Etheostoma spectabile]